MPSVVGMIGVGQALVQLGHRATTRDGDQVTAAEPADLALHPALLMRAAHAGLAEERVEPVVAAQRDEPLVLHPVAALQDPVNRRPAGCRSGSAAAPHPSAANASTWPSRNASWAWLANATWNALPER